MSNTPGTTPSADELSMAPELAIQTETPSEEETQETESTTETTAAEEATQSSDDGASQTEEVADGETASEETETESAQRRVLGYDDLLPQEQGDEYPEELYALAGKRWKLTDEQLQDESIRSLLKDKINADIEIKKERAAKALADSESEGDKEAEGEEAEGEETTEAPQPVDLESAVTTAIQEVMPYITPQGAKAYTDTVGAAYTELQEAQDSGDEKAIATAQQKVAATQMAFVRAAVQSFLPDMVAQTLQQTVVSTQQEEQKVMAAYDAGLKLAAQDPQYKDVLDAKKNGQFKELLSRYDHITQMRFKGPDGKLLPLLSPQNIAEQYKYGMTLIRGSRAVSPEKSFKAGAEAQRKTQERQQAAAAAARTGKGRTTSGKFAQPGPDDDLQQRLVKAHAFSDPLANPTA
jgi:hypothetical protein